MPRALLLVATMLVASGARAQQPVEQCLPGSSCWARLQSVDALGQRTADVAGEVQRLAERDPELVVLARVLADASAQLRVVDRQLHEREIVQVRRLAEALQDLQAAIDRMRDQGTRYSGYGELIGDVEDIAQEIGQALERADGLKHHDLARLTEGIASLGQRLGGAMAIPNRPPKDPDSAPAGRAAPKISVRDPLMNVYGCDISLRLGVVAVPDPRIPRYRRSFDLMREAIMRAMSAHGAHFDRVDLPWRADQMAPVFVGAAGRGRPPKIDPDHAECDDPKELDPSKRGSGAGTAADTHAKAADGKQTAAAAAPAGLAHDFLRDVGLMTFRKDCRYVTKPGSLCDSTGNPTIVALYLVAERGSDGPDAQAARDAWHWADWHARRFASDASVATFAPLNTSAIGPWRDLWDEESPRLERREADGAHRWFSPTVTALAVEADADVASEAAGSIQPRACNRSGLHPLICLLARPDEARFDALKDYLGPVRWNVLAENSRYGDLSNVAGNGGEFLYFRFPPGIWELELSPAKSGSPDQGQGVLSGLQRRYARELLFDEKDRGDEFPQAFAHAIGARTQELALERAMQDYVEANQGESKPTLIVAADVRDQLVVARAARVARPDAQLVFFDADELLSHPAYVGATRGALVVPAGNLNPCGADGAKHRFAKDEVALSFEALHAWLSPEMSAAACQASAGAKGDVATSGLMVVTRAGLRPLAGIGEFRGTETLPALLVGILVVALALWSAAGTRESLGYDGRGHVAWFLPAAIGGLFLFAASAVLARGPHAGPGVSPALALSLLVLGFGLALLLARVARVTALERRRLPLIYPQILPRAPSVVPFLLMAVSPILLVWLGDGRAWKGWFDPGVAFPQDALVAIASMLGLAATILAAISLSLALRRWSLLRRDVALCRIGFDSEAARDWNGHPRLPNSGIAYFAQMSVRTEALDWAAPQAVGGAVRRRLLAADIVGLRAWLHLSLALSLLGVLSVQAHPVNWHARLLQLDLAIGLIATGILFVLLLGMGREKLLSDLFCGGRGFELGPRTTALIVTGVLVAASLLYLAIAPDGSDWYDELFLPLLNLNR